MKGLSTESSPETNLPKLCPETFPSSKYRIDVGEHGSRETIVLAGTTCTLVVHTSFRFPNTNVCKEMKKSMLIETNWSTFLAEKRVTLPPLSASKTGLALPTLSNFY